MTVVQFGTIPSDNAVVFHSTSGTYTASSFAVGYPPLNASLQDTYSNWRPSLASGVQYITIDKGANEQINAIGVDAHNLATSGVSSISLQYSTDNSTYNTIGTVAMTTDAGIIALFPSVTARYIRLSWSGPAANIGVFQAAKRLDFETPAMLPYTPVQHSRNFTKDFSNSIQGHFIGNRVIARGAQTTANLQMQTTAFVEGPLMPFEDHYNKGGCFFYAGVPNYMPKDMGYCQAGGEDDTMSVDYIEDGKLANISFSMNIYQGV